MKQSFGRRIASRISYANVMSTLALFLALGGISYAAATLPKNSVGTKQIKKNGVTASDIRKNAVTTAKLKANAVTSAKIKANAVDGSDVMNDALTGDDINESTLGAVPAAATAGTTSDRFSVLQRVTVSAVTDVEATARAAATEVPIASHGQVTVYAKCFKEGDADNVTGELRVRTTAIGSLSAGYAQYDYIDGNPSLRPDTPETSRGITSTTASPGTAVQDNASGSSTIGADGRGILLDTVIYVLNGPTPDPGLAFPAEESCIFHVRGAKTG